MVGAETSLEVRTLEEKSLNAWPALRREVRDGWLLGFSGGYTRRANCVHVLYPGTQDRDAKIAACEAAYERAGLPAVFKVSPAALSLGMEEALGRRGYAREAPTIVQTRGLEGRAASEAGVEVALGTDAGWMSTYAAMKGLRAREVVLADSILRQATGQAGFATVYDGREPAAMGMGIVEDEYAGLFGLVTEPGRRRRGFGTRLVRALLDFGRRGGARTAYLQVEASNEGALALYERLGFREVYRYWYRVRGMEA